jgi:hypothetical protein
VDDLDGAVALSESALERLVESGESIWTALAATAQVEALIQRRRRRFRSRAGGDGSIGGNANGSRLRIARHHVAAIEEVEGHMAWAAER